VHHSLNQPAAPPHHTPSAAAIWPPLRPFIAGEACLGLFMARRRWTAWLYEFIRFGVKQAWACLFGGIAVALMIGTWRFYPADAPLARYDFLFLSMIAVQVALLAGRLETLEEAKVILIYHVVGWLSENIGTFTKTWLYPSQRHGWSMVSFDKLGSWFLLLIISYTLVSLINAPRAMLADKRKADSHLAGVADVPETAGA
jgi:uncharacterized membrane protein YoaT (DUF817 family)